MNTHLIQSLAEAARLSADDDTELNGGLRFLDRRENAKFYDFPTIYQRSLKAAGALYTAGVRENDRVAIILPTCMGFIDAFLGCQVLGAIPVPMYPPVRLGKLDEYFNRSAAMLKAVSAVAIISNFTVNRVLGKLIPLYPLRLGFIDADKLAKGTARPLQNTSPDHLAMVQFSSGTTVDPKAVALTHRQIMANAAVISDDILANANCEKQSGISWLPLYHDMGLIGCILPAVINSAPLTLIPPEVFLAKPAIWLRGISRYKANVSTAPNFAYALCNERVKDADLDGCDLSSWNIALCGAEPIAPETLREFTQRFTKWGLPPNALTPVYGLSEASLAVTFSDISQPMKTLHIDREALSQGKVCLSDDDNAWEIVSAGRPLPGFAIEIRDDAGTQLPDGEEGLLYVAGPSLCNGYLDRAESPIENGWLNTGDIGFIQDNELYITGRKKDVIILNGQNHMPHEIERALDSVDGMRKGCAAAVSDIGPEGERLLVFAEVRSSQPLGNEQAVQQDALANKCQQAIIAATGVDPDLLILLAPGTIPRTSSGKIRRKECLRLWQTQQLTAPDKVTPLKLAGAMAASFKEMMVYKLKKSG